MAGLISTWNAHAFQRESWVGSGDERLSDILGSVTLSLSAVCDSVTGKLTSIATYFCVCFSDCHTLHTVPPDTHN